jgi:hypothetical protein
VERDRHEEVASLANEDGDQCRTDRLRERLPTGGEEAKQRQGEECGCVQDGRDAREAGAVGDMVGVRSDLLESHIRGLAACTPPWRSRTRTDAVEGGLCACSHSAWSDLDWSAARRASGGRPLAAGCLRRRWPAPLPTETDREAVCEVQLVARGQFGGTVHGV